MFLVVGKVFFIARGILYQIVTFHRDPKHVTLKFQALNCSRVNTVTREVPSKKSKRAVFELNRMLEIF